MQVPARILAAPGVNDLPPLVAAAMTLAPSVPEEQDEIQIDDQVRQLFNSALRRTAQSPAALVAITQQQLAEEAVSAEVIRLASAIRPANTLLSYNKKQEEWARWCDREYPNIPGRYLVTSSKMFHIWKYRMIGYLKGKGLWKIVDKGRTPSLREEAGQHNLTGDIIMLMTKLDTSEQRKMKTETTGPSRSAQGHHHLASKMATRHILEIALQSRKFNSKEKDGISQLMSLKGQFTWTKLMEQLPSCVDDKAVAMSIKSKLSEIREQYQTAFRAAFSTAPSTHVKGYYVDERNRIHILWKDEEETSQKVLEAEVMTRVGRTVKEFSTTSPTSPRTLRDRAVKEPSVSVSHVTDITDISKNT
ncbi:hypothetical protein BC829DRAFT_442772 [Chytridium lagenaria]|nr:hypothetical protein BC829DRAFT_442772 [Chytridium lagenaria]